MGSIIITVLQISKLRHRKSNDLPKIIKLESGKTRIPAPHSWFLPSRLCHPWWHSIKSNPRIQIGN